MKYIGIDLGSYSLKHFEIETSNKDIRLVNYQEHVLSQDPSNDNELQVIEHLRNLQQSYDPDSTRFVIGLPQNQVSTRYKIFPFKEKSKIFKSIPFELEDEIPIDIDDAVFSAKIIRYRGKTSDTLTSASPKKNVQDLIEQVKGAGIDPEIISIEGFALSNLIENFSQAIPTLPSPPEEEDDETEKIHDISPADILLNIGHTKTVVSIFRDSVLVNCRSIEWGGKDIALSIASQYSIHYQEALKELQIKSYILTDPEGASKDQIAFSDVISKSIDELLRELRISLMNIKSELHLNFSHVYLTGGTSRIKNLPNYINSTLNIPCSPLDYLNKFSSLEIEISSKVLALAGTSLGFALEGARKANNPPINLRKDEFAKKSENLKIFWDQWGYSLRLATIALIGFFIYVFSKNYFANDLSDKAYKTLKKQARIVGLKGSNARPAGIKRFLKKKTFEIKNKEILSKLFDMNSSLDILEKISQSTPGKDFLDVNISNLSLNSDKASLQGYVRNVRQLRTLEKALKRFAHQGEFSKIPVKSTSRTKINFHYNFKVDRNISNER